MRIVEHIKVIYLVKEEFTHVIETELHVPCLLLGLSMLLLVHDIEGVPLLFRDTALPCSYLTVVEGHQECSSWVEGGHGDGGHCVLCSL